MQIVEFSVDAAQLVPGAVLFLDQPDRGIVVPTADLGEGSPVSVEADLVAAYAKYFGVEPVLVRVQISDGRFARAALRVAPTACTVRKLS